MCLHIELIDCTAGKKTRIFPSPFFISTNPLVNLAEAFRNDYVAACSTALRSSAERNEMGGFVTTPCSSKMTQRSGRADWIKLL